MRFLKLFFVLLGLFILLPLPGYFFYTEITTWWGAWQLRNDFRHLIFLTANPVDEHKNLCRKIDSVIAGYQLRFISSKEYVIELVCGSDIYTYHETNRKQTRGNLTKISGSGALYNPRATDTKAGVLLKNAYRKIYVGIKEHAAVMSYRAEGQTLAGASPKTSCEGWSGACCMESEAVGQGEGLPATDCPNQCFAACLQRPAVSQFYPLIDLPPEGQLYTIGNRNLVTFEYEAVDTDGQIEALAIDFGDGVTFTEPLDPKSVDVKKRPRNLVRGAIEHQYVCEDSECVFVARMEVRDNDGMIRETLANQEYVIRVINDEAYLTE